MKKLLLLLLCLSALGGLRAQVFVSGAGSTFSAPALSRWFLGYAKVDATANFNYDPRGSGEGIRRIVAQTVDFGVTDAPVTDAILATCPGKVLHLPILAGGVAIVYNLPGISTLNLDGATLAGIYLGQIASWKDPRIARQNPKIALPDLPISPVCREDSSGTSFIFTDYLSQVNPDWAASLGKGASLHWPIGWRATGSDEMAATVKKNPGTIGYVELAYARRKGLAVASLKNAAGQFVAPSPASVSAALASVEMPDDFRFSMVNAPGADSYPIASVSWMLVFQDQHGADAGKLLVAFIRWAETEGQKISPDLDYAPLPANIVHRVLTRLDDIKY